MGIDITILFDKENVKLVNALNMAIIGQGGKVIKPNTSVTKQQTQISTHINHMYCSVHLGQELLWQSRYKKRHQLITSHAKIGLRLFCEA